MAENLVLIGGTVMLPGFAHRLIGELKELLERPYYKERLAISSFKIHSPPCEANYTAWLGGKFNSLLLNKSRNMYQKNEMMWVSSRICARCSKLKQVQLI